MRNCLSLLHQTNNFKHYSDLTKLGAKNPLNFKENNLIKSTNGRTVARDEDIFANFFLLPNPNFLFDTGKLVHFTLVWVLFTPFLCYIGL